MSRTKWSLLPVLFAYPALAQTDATYLLVSSSIVSPAAPTTTIEIWATWSDPGAWFVFGYGSYDLTAGDGDFSNAVNALNGPGSSTGVIAGNVISGAIIGQLVGPPALPMIWDNPILLATYDWTTTDFRPRSVDLHTSNTGIFSVFSPFTGEAVQLYPNDFSPGSGVMNVVPTPGVWFAIALPLVAGRRRRC